MHDYWIGDRIWVTSEEAEGLFAGEREGLALVKINGVVKTFAFEDLTLLPEEDNIFIEIHSDRDAGSPAIPFAQRADTIDLHIEVLNPTLIHAEPAMILAHQVSRLKGFMARAVDQRIRRITIVHGKGIGVLRSEVLSYLESLPDIDHIEGEEHGGAVVVYLR